MADGADNHVEIPPDQPNTACGIRASDADRLATVLVLQDAMARGLLNPDEASERMATAFAAVHRRDLDPLTADLRPAPLMNEGPPGWHALGRMAIDQVRISLHDTATGRPGHARVALAFLLLVLLMLAVGVVMADFVTNMWATTGPRGFGHH